MADLYVIVNDSNFENINKFIQIKTEKYKLRQIKHFDAGKSKGFTCRFNSARYDLTIK